MPHDHLLQQSIERVWDTLPAVWGGIRANVRENAIRDCNITLIQFHILRHIRRGAHTVGEIAQQQQISRPAISHSVDLLVDKHLVTRTQDAHDRRFVYIDLTRDGNELLDYAFKKSRTWMGEKMKSLSPNDLETLILGMTILKDVFEPSV